MSVKVKRGLGLLVVALIALFVQWLAYSGTRTTWTDAVGVIAGMVLLIGVVGGLVLLAWGLLRD